MGDIPALLCSVWSLLSSSLLRLYITRSNPHISIDTFVGNQTPSTVVMAPKSPQVTRCTQDSVHAIPAHPVHHGRMPQASALSFGQ